MPVNFLRYRWNIFIYLKNVYNVASSMKKRRCLAKRELSLNRGNITNNGVFKMMSEWHIHTILATIIFEVADPFAATDAGFAACV